MDHSRPSLPAGPARPAPSHPGGAAPASFAQERLWLVDRLGGGSGAYHVFRAFSLSGPLRADVLERALAETVRRHESLRTTLCVVDGAPVQAVRPFDGFSLPVEDLSTLGAEARGQAARSRLEAESERPFDLAAGPLFRALLLRLGGDDHVLALHVHHAVADGWSLGVLFRELSALYSAFLAGLPSPLAEPPLRYAEHAARQRARLTGQALERHLAFWRARLAGAPPLLELPTDRPRPAVESHAGASVAAALPDALVERLHALARAEGASLYMVLLAAYQVLLAKLADRGDVVVGTPVAGRTREEEEGVVGLFANTLALRADLSGDPTFLDVLRRARAEALAAYDHQDLPFEKLVAELRPERSASHSPLFQAMFSFEAGLIPDLRLGEVRGTPLPVERPVSQFDLSLAVGRSAGTWSATAYFRTDLFDRATAERILSRYRALLEQAAAAPETRLSALEAMDAAERRTLEAWGAARERARVLDAALRPVPIGVAGELCLGAAREVGGDAASAGATAERFVPDPFSAEPGARLVRTGERARWRADGALERLGERIEVRGRRVETGEVEAALGRHPEVRECAVIGSLGADGEARLVAYVAGDADGDALLDHLRGAVPEYMLPAAIVRIDGLPRAADGTLDRAALPAPDAAPAAGPAAPRTPAEERVAAIWGEVLGIGRVGADDRFFDLGGHSLLASRVLSRIREAFGVEVPLRAFFAAPTVAGLAARVESPRGGDADPSASRFFDKRSGPFPLSFGQERLWFLDRLRPGTSLYNLPAALRLRGSLDAPALERALGELVRRHQALRTVFPEMDGAPVQVIAPFAGFALSTEDLTGVDSADREAEAIRRMEGEAARPFDLAAGPPFRALLLRLAEDDHRLLLVFHHAVADGWSLGIVFRELSALYAGFVSGAPPRLPDPPRYADFAAWQREHLRGDVVERGMAYWRERLAGAPVLLDLPTDRPRPAIESNDGGTVSTALPAWAMERLESLGREEGATPFMVLLAAFAALLAKWRGSGDVVVGTPAAGRPRREVEDAVGFFVDTLVLRTDLSGDPSFRQALRRAREAVLGAHEHQEVPFEALVAELRPERSLGHSPLFQVMFAVEADGAPAPRLPGIAAEAVDVEVPVARFDLSLLARRSAAGWRADARYRADLFDRATVERILGHLGRLLDGAAAAPDVPLSALETMDEAERRRVLEEWNRTEIDAPAGCIHPSIEEQAARTPDAVAVVSGGESLTYRQVDERANRLAHRLVRLGAGPEARVGICLERGAGTVVALLAVLKAGAAYVPLDPSYPADRLAYMLEDSGASLLLTQASLRGLVPAGGARIVPVDDDAAAIAAEPDEAPRSAVDPGNAAYVIYTSGSTGRPKGVVVTHANVAAYFAGLDGRLGGHRPGTWLAVTRISFDIHVTELLWTLARGFRVVVAPDLERATADETTARLLRRHAPTHLQCTPSLAEMVIAEGGVQALAGLERLVLAGEALPADLAARIGAVIPGALVNLYGPTETTVGSTTHAVRETEGTIPIGPPIAGTRVYVLDDRLRPRPACVSGELFIGGAGVTRGYLGRPALTAERFLPDPFSPVPGARVYRTGDRVRFRADGALEYLGRLDAQVKIRGFRVEPGEVEAALRGHAGVRECAVVARGDGSAGTRLIAYVAGDADAAALRAYLRRRLPEHMVPAAFVLLDRLPLTPSGKLDRRALPAPAAAPAAPSRPPRGEMEARVAAVWREVLGCEDVGVRESFFDVGGSSFLLYRVYARLREIRGDLSVVDLFRHPTVESLARHLADGSGDAPRVEADVEADGGKMRRDADESPRRGSKEKRRRRPVRRKATAARDDGRIAVVGMSCRFPGARDVDEFWRNLCVGVDAISRFSEDDLLAAGISPETVRDRAFVPAHGALADAYAFDAAFFGIAPPEARVMDPQHRVFLECAYAALEDAGVDPTRFSGAVGVFAGSGTTSHYARVLAHPELVAAAGAQTAALANAKEFLTTRVSHRLGLRGPSVAVGTACSTSLVAVHLACRALRAGECDVALAGGVTIGQDQVTGYLHQEGGIGSPDGRCRAFDADAAGTVFGSGAGVVALKRLSDALRDGDTVRAVILGSAINNDGGGKMSFTAPAVEGQARVITAALADAGVHPSTVSYVEAHGTGTPLGDPIEVAALAQAFGSGGPAGRCAMGAVKTSVGHLDTAAGVAGLIKAVLALEHRVLPPTLHFRAPGPETGLAGSPFFVNAELRDWARNGSPLRAGVSSFGFGGTNAHVVLEEAPHRPSSSDADGPHLLALSAKSDAALERMRGNLARHLAENPHLPLSDVAYTLAEGRSAHPHRWSTAVANLGDARDALADPSRGSARRAADRSPPVAFLFPGQGTQYAGMARGLYAREPVFRREIDRCAQVLAPEIDLRAALFPASAGDDADALLRRTQVTQPALFAVEYALAALWASWGVRPDCMLGHSVGEYVAATLAGVFSPEDALRLVAARGRLMQALPPGAMLAVPLAEAELRPLLSGRLSLAAVNAVASCVVSGETAEVEAMEARLADRGVSARRLRTSHAFHSAAMDPVLHAFAAEVRRARPAAPSIPFLSNVTGGWITAGEAADPAYWVRHLRQTVRFADGVGRLLEDGDRVLLEVGPGDALGTFARRAPGGADRVIVRSLPRATEAGADDASMLDAVGALWTAGVEIDWPALRLGERRRKVSLPAYPFERTEYRVPSVRAAVPSSSVVAAPSESYPALAIATDRIASPAMPSRVETASPARHRAAVADRVAGMFAGLLGREPAEMDGGRTFLELGADSLLLMQATRGIETAFGVRVPFRRLMEGLATVDDLAAYLAREAPADPHPAPADLPPVALADAHPAPTEAEGVAIPDAFARQLAILESHAATMRAQAEAMQAHAAILQAQMEALRGGGSPRVAAPDLPSPSSNGHHAQSPAVVPSTNGHASASPVIAARNGHHPDADHPPILDTRTEARPDATASHGPHRPVAQTLREGGGFTQRQARHFRALVERYTARTRRSKEYAAVHRPRLADNRASLNFRMATKELLYPIVGAESRGSRMWDVDGNEYVDFTMGFGVHFFGHRPAFVMEAVEEQLRRGVHLGPQSDLAGPAADLFCALTGMERAAFCNTGSEAVMTALRVARAVTGRDRIVIFEGSYHGCFDGVLARGGGSIGAPPLPVAPGTPPGMVADVVVLPYGTPEALEYLRAHASNLAAVLVEPVQSRNPEFQPRDFLREVREITRGSGTALVFDEMITGLRLGAAGAQGWYGVEADLAVYGKVAGGGFPIGIVAGRHGLMDALDGGAWRYGDDSYPAAGQTFFAGTFCKHPVAMAAACAVLRHLRERGPALHDELHARAARLVSALRAVLAEERVPMRIVHCASIFHFRPEPRFRFADLLFHHLLERGVYVWEGRACYLSTAHTDDDCDRLVDALRDSIHALRDGGFLPDAEDLPSESDDRPGAIGTSTAFPLTPAQRAIREIARDGGDASRAYNEQIVIGVRGPLDLTALRAALEDLARHHEALRTAIDPSGDVQRVLPALDSVPLTAGDASPSIDVALREAVGVAFGLAAGPPFRLHVHSPGPDRHVLQMVVHHLAADGVALAILRRDLEAAYRARRDGEAPRLAEAMQFGEYAGLLAAARARDDGGAGEAEWIDRFRGALPLIVPPDRDGPHLPTYRGARETRVLDAALVDALKEAARREGCTLFVVLLGAVLAVAHRLSGRGDGVVAISSAGRPFPRSDTVVGNCADLLPLRSHAPGDVRRGDPLRELRRRVLDACEHEHLSWARLRERLGGTIPPLPALVFNLEPGGIGLETEGEFAGMAIERVAAPSPYTKYPIGIDAVESRGAIHLLCTYDASRYEPATIARMLGDVERTLAEVAPTPTVTAT